MTQLTKNEQRTLAVILGDRRAAFWDRVLLFLFGGMGIALSAILVYSASQGDLDVPPLQLSTFILLAAYINSLVVISRQKALIRKLAAAVSDNTQADPEAIRSLQRSRAIFMVVVVIVVALVLLRSIL